MTSVRRFAASLVVLGCLANVGTARAQNASDKAAAEALFREGRKLEAAGQYPAACAKLAESQRLDPAPGTLLNLAGCYEKNGQTASAWATFQQAASASRQKGRADWADLATTRATALEPNLSRLTIAVSVASTPGLEVRRDGAVVGQAEWGTAIPVDPGPHVVDAQAPNRTAFHQSVDVAGGAASATVTIPDLGSEMPSTPPEAPSKANNGSLQRTIGLVVAGVGIVGIGVGTAFGLVAMNKESDALSHDCTADKYCTPAGLQLGHDANSAATASNIAFGVAAAALAGGLLVFFLAPKDTSAAPAVGLRVEALHGGAAMGLTGAW